MMLEMKTQTNIIRIGHHPYRILITGGSRSRKRNALLNLIKKQDDTNY